MHDAANGRALCRSRARRGLTARLARRHQAGPGHRLDARRRSVGARGAVSITRLREQSGWSKTRLATTFSEQVGVSPKQYARVMRFITRHAADSRGVAASLADVAVEAGYYDQPHMNAEFKELSGFTPSEFLHAHRFPNSVSVAEASRAPLSSFFQDAATALVRSSRASGGCPASKEEDAMVKDYRRPGYQDGHTRASASRVRQPSSRSSSGRSARARGEIDWNPTTRPWGTARS